MPRAADQRILTLNSGSSSLRFARYHMGAAEQLEARGYIDRIGVGDGRFRLSDADGKMLIDRQVSVPDHRAALEVLLEWLEGSEGVSAVGHRVVHGGAEYRDPQPVTPELLATLKKLVPLAPEHLPYQIAAMETIGERYPSAQQIACFDTAFHRGMPEVAQVYALPQDPRWEGVIRYGFHGLSCEYIMSELRAEAGDGVAEGRVIIAHLGNGASMTAVRGGRSVDTTMGLTPTGGLVMSTRAGDLDPSVVLYLIVVGGLSAAEAHRLLNHQSGLLGLSGRTSDMKDLEGAGADDPRAALAVSVFCYQARKFLAALAAGMGGLDDVVFTGGIGENAAPIRWRICESMEFLGLRLDPARNEAGASIISHPESRVTVRVMKTNEELMIARHVNRLVRVGRSEPMKRTVSRTETPKGPLSKEELRKLDAYWRASLYLCVGMIYLRENPLLREPLKIEQIKKRLLGHWGSTPGQSFIWVHLNRLIKRDDLNMIYISGPGHGAPAVLANAYLEGTYSQVYPEMSEDEEGMQKFFKQFSFPGGIGSHCTPETPGSMHEGGELGYSLSHAFGAAFDNPDLIVAAVVGDGEAETGPLATSWHSNKFLNPIRDGAVLPILHLNGYKIANPTVLARIPHEQLESLFVGYGYKPYFVEGSDPEAMHQVMAETLERCVAEIKEIQQKARSTGEAELPQWPMIVLRTPKGWTGPKEVDGHKVEGYWRSHQVPFQIHDNPSHLALLEEWMRSYRPEELFDGEGRLIEELRELPPTGQRRMSANRVTNGGIIPQALRLPDFRDYAVEVPEPGTTMAGGPGILGQFLRDTMRENPDRFRVFGPDETASNRLTAIYEVSKKTWLEETLPEDADGGELAPDGRVMEMLSEHTLEGWLEGYTLSGRHGFFASYEAFMHVVDSMFNQHAKWLAKCREIPWRAPVPSLNLLVTSTVWRQDHNGFSHQDPGFLDVVTTKSPDVTRIYLPPDANCLLSVGDHCLHSMNYVNVIVSDKYPHLQYLTMDEAIQHCTKGLGIWDWASTDEGSEPEVVLACAGDIPTTEALAAAAMLRESFPDLKLRFVNIVDLFKLQPESEHPHGMSDRDFDSVFTIDKPIIMGFHGYPWLIHKLAYRRTNHSNLHVRGYKEQGNINTPLELAMLNHTDRFSLAIDVIDRVPRLRVAGAHAKEWLKNQIIENTNYAHDEGEDKPEMTNWVWPGKAPAKGRIGLRKAA